MADEVQFHGWKIEIDWSGDVVFPHVARGTKPNEHGMHSLGQTAEEAVERLKSQIVDQECRYGGANK